MGGLLPTKNQHHTPKVDNKLPTLLAVARQMEADSSMNAIVKTQNSPRPLLPRLRFAEFRGAGGWDVKSLKTACELNPPNALLPENFVYIDLESVEAGELKLRKIINKDEAPSRAQRLLRDGDVLFQMVRPYQRNNFHFKTDEEIAYVASTGYAQLRANESNDFLFHAVHTDDFVERVIAKCTGSNYPAINSSDLADIHLAVPSKAEQQKIAACLTSLDTLITAQTQKLDTLKTHKKGLMQQLFPRAGETTPRLRFAEFRGEWESVPLGSLGKFFRGLTYGSNDVADGGLLVLRSSNIQGGRLILDSDLVFVAKQCPSDLRLRRGDVVICMSNGSKALVGKSAELDRDYSGELTVGAFCSIFRPLIHFAKIAFDTQQYADFVSIGIAGGNINNLKNSDLEAFEFHIPQEEAEQQKIAACLSSLDELITAQAQKVTALQTHKKGLMQQLFPAQAKASA